MRRRRRYVVVNIETGNPLSKDDVAEAGIHVQALAAADCCRRLVELEMDDQAAALLTAAKGWL